jgi:TPR repeat protein
MAQCNLGVLFEEGQGVVQSDVEAVRWYRLSAEQGNAGGQNNLARMYEHGRGVAQDIGASLMWYRRAADQGNGQAQASLGRLYYEGKGVRQDDVAAHLWSSLSAARGSRTAASIRDAVGRRMSATQIRQAEQLFREWAPTQSTSSPSRIDH